MSQYLKGLALAAVIASAYAIGYQRADRLATARWVQITATILHHVDEETEETDEPCNATPVTGSVTNHR